MKIRLNLAASPQANHRPFAVFASLTGTVGVIALLLLSRAAYQSLHSNRELRLHIDQLQTQIRDDSRKQQELESYFGSSAARGVLDRSSFLNSLIDARTFPWTKIFMDLEQTLPVGVRVVSISPRLVDGRAEVTLEVGATSDESKIQFLKSIETSKMFSGLVVTDEKRVDQAGTPDKVVLNLKVWYSTT